MDGDAPLVNKRDIALRHSRYRHNSFSAASHYHRIIIAAFSMCIPSGAQPGHSYPTGHAAGNPSIGFAVA
jgi:hypothetical protein